MRRERRSPGARACATGARFVVHEDDQSIIDLTLPDCKIKNPVVGIDGDGRLALPKPPVTSAPLAYPTVTDHIFGLSLAANRHNHTELRRHRLGGRTASTGAAQTPRES